MEDLNHEMRFMQKINVYRVPYYAGAIYVFLVLL